MKKNILLLTGIAILSFFQSCEKTNLDAYAPHFHANAERIDEEQVLAHIKVPGRLGENLIYLESVRPINEVRESPMNRAELVLAEFVFTTDPDKELIGAQIADGVSWDSNCDIITAKGKAAKGVNIASILISLPNHIEKKYSAGKANEERDSECYELFSSITSPKQTNFGLIYFHPGHEWENPEFGHGIEIK